jgi:methylenetetrahydrofolate reductase (NADPH)
MKVESKLAGKIESGEFILTAEYLPTASADAETVAAAVKAMGAGPAAINVGDSHNGIAMSSLAASAAVLKAGPEPIYQVVTRDRNRLALQADLLGAASLGIRNVLCLSGYHQTLTDCPQSANVYDIDSIQLLDAARKMRDESVLMNGMATTGDFSVLLGAAANPYLEPLELNIIRLAKKVRAGASFIQTQAVFDTDRFAQWLDAAISEGIADSAAIIAGVLPLASAREAVELSEKYTEMRIPDEVVQRLKSAGDEASQKKEGLAICCEVVKKIKGMKGLRGIHIFSGGREESVQQVISACGL